MGIVAGSAAPFEDSAFWNPIPFSWPVALILLAVCALLTIAVVVWLVVQPDEPETGSRSRALVERATGRDRRRADTVRRRLEADAGRADPSEPELR
ncbi:hypothetical protein [Brachybacterium sp. YJGR34]|uniref:hypothetical protein n=1 Tax=Brachybacterium sp. YJGR34 TaxID=2059911 RepID=UPI000E0B51CE|nr:hypothetical protein [Brachybacterium sp. YJGR34]